MNNGPKERVKNMKISNAFYFKLNNYNFKRTVDYGAKDNELVYIPILFEEDDSFQSSSSTEPQNGCNNDSNGGSGKYTPKKIGRAILTTGGGLITAAEVVPDTISNFVNKTANVAKNSMEQIKSVKETYNETFPKSAQKSAQKAEEENRKTEQNQNTDEDYNPYDTLGNKSEETNSTSNYRNIDDDNADIAHHDSDDYDDSDTDYDYE